MIPLIKRRRTFVQKGEEHVLLWEEDYSIRVETWRKGSACSYSYFHMRYLKELTPSLGRRCCTFQKNLFSSLPNFLLFFEFSLLYLQFSSPCLSTQEDLLAFATLPRAKINLSLQNFLSAVRYLLPSCLLSIFFLKKEKKIRRRTFIYIYSFFSFFRKR